MRTLTWIVFPFLVVFLLLTGCNTKPPRTGVWKKTPFGWEEFKRWPWSDSSLVGQVPVNKVSRHAEIWVYTDSSPPSKAIFSGREMARRVLPVAVRHQESGGKKTQRYWILGHLFNLSDELYWDPKPADNVYDASKYVTRYEFDLSGGPIGVLQEREWKAIAKKVLVERSDDSLWAFCSFESGVPEGEIWYLFKVQ